MIDWVQLGRIVVLPVDEPPELQLPLPEDYQPLMLLVLNSTDAVEWEDLQTKVYSYLLGALHTATDAAARRERRLPARLRSR